MTLIEIVVLVALVCAVVAAAGKKYAPLWLAVVLVTAALLWHLIGTRPGA